MSGSPSQPFGCAGIKCHQGEKPEADQEIEKVRHGSTHHVSAEGTREAYQISIGNLAERNKERIKESLRDKTE